MQINELIDTKPIELSKNSLILDKVARKKILGYFKEIKEGQITVKENSDHMVFGEVTPKFPLKQQLKFKTKDVYGYRCKRLNGSADAFIKGWWTCDNLTKFW
ncbi:MAG: hypothetical protein Ct9H300mP5_3960 [Candidatus Pelagibacterales bacterium]|nr:MAG: hypothetical protein Ct9H300mP5_3960 [Pelagibacterales bacterium]